MVRGKGEDYMVVFNLCNNDGESLPNNWTKHSHLDVALRHYKALKEFSEEHPDIIHTVQLRYDTKETWHKPLTEEQISELRDGSGR